MADEIQFSPRRCDRGFRRGSWRQVWFRGRRIASADFCEVFLAADLLELLMAVSAPSQAAPAAISSPCASGVSVLAPALFKRGTRAKLVPSFRLQPFIPQA
jgi:hypothetical protein